MKIELCALSVKNKDINHNLNTLLSKIESCDERVDLLMFGEAFLHGFDGLTWDYESDIKIAISINDARILKIKEACKNKNVGISFGFIEKDEDKIFSSYLTINKEGEIIDIFRRVSPGWKERHVDKRYQEGTSFHSFSYLGETIVVGLCGDFWYEENVKKISMISKSLVLWPVYTDFYYVKWNNELIYEYASQSKLLGDKVLLVNSFSLEGKGKDVAKGGACYFYKGNIITSIKAGKEGSISIEI